MEVRSESAQKVVGSGGVIGRRRLQVWFIRVCSSILLWTCLVQLVAVGELWHPRFFKDFTHTISIITTLQLSPKSLPPPPPLPPASESQSLLPSIYN